MVFLIKSDVIVIVMIDMHNYTIDSISSRSARKKFDVKLFIYRSFKARGGKVTVLMGLRSSLAYKAERGRIVQADENEPLSK